MQQEYREIYERLTKVEKAINCFNDILLDKINHELRIYDNPFFYEDTLYSYLTRLNFDKVLYDKTVVILQLKIWMLKLQKIEFLNRFKEYLLIPHFEDIYNELEYLLEFVKDRMEDSEIEELYEHIDTIREVTDDLYHEVMCVDYKFVDYDIYDEDEDSDEDVN